MVVERIGDFIQLIDESIEENSHLITVMGVFGAISVYLSNLQETWNVDSPALVVGILSSLSLFILLGVTVNYNLYAKFELSWVNLFFFGSYNSPYLIVLLPLNAIILSVVVLSFSFEGSGQVFIAALGFAFGIAFYSAVLVVIIGVWIIRDRLIPERVRSTHDNSTLKSYIIIVMGVTYVSVVGWGYFSFEIPELFTQDNFSVLFLEYMLFAGLIQVIPHTFLRFVRLILSRVVNS